MRKIKAGNTIKFIGLAATILGFISTMISGWVNDKNMEKVVEDKVNEALKSLNK